LNRLCVDFLVKFTGRLEAARGTTFVEVDSMKLVEHDDDLIPKRESIPTSPINDIKTDEKFYRVLAEVVSK
jgi:hypothetical protein